MFHWDRCLNKRSFLERQTFRVYLSSIQSQILTIFLLIWNWIHLEDVADADVKGCIHFCSFVSTKHFHFEKHFSSYIIRNIFIWLLPLHKRTRIVSCALFNKSHTLEVFNLGLFKLCSVLSVWARRPPKPCQYWQVKFVDCGSAQAVLFFYFLSGTTPTEAVVT